MERHEQPPAEEKKLQNGDIVGSIEEGSKKTIDQEVDEGVDLPGTLKEL